MDTIFMNSENHDKLLLNLSDKMDLKRNDEYVALSNLSIHDTWKNIKKSYKNNKSKISIATWNKEFELFDGSHSVSDRWDYFGYIIKKHETWNNEID